MGEWTLFSNHGHVLVCLANNSQARLRDVSAAVGITERAVQNILRELQVSGLVQVSKHGRCNHYQINHRKPLRHPLEEHCTVGKLLQMLKAGNVDGEGDAAASAQSAQTKVRKPPRPATKAKPVPNFGPNSVPNSGPSSEPSFEPSFEPGPLPVVVPAQQAVASAVVLPATTEWAEPESVAPEPAAEKPDTDKKAKQRKSDSPAPGTQQGSLF